MSARRALVVATLFASAAAATSCRNVIGLTEYTFVDDSELASGGGAAGAGGGAAHCGDAQPKPSSDAVAACVYATGCTIFPPVTLSGCLTFSSLEAIGGLACLHTVTSCADVNACLGEGILPSATCSSSGHWTCDGHVATYCDASVTFERDCSRFGGDCDSAAAAVADASHPPCVIPGETCSSPDVVACDGDTFLACSGGKPFGVVCTQRSGARCTTSADGTHVACVYGSACPTDLPPGSGRCDDATHGKACGAYDTAVSVDCGASGLVCVPTASSFLCLPPGCTAADAQASACAEACTDTKTATVCVGSFPFTVDCSAYGNGTCFETTTVEDGKPVSRAYCRPAP